MEKLKYAETVIEQVHTMTLQGRLNWKCGAGSTVSADLTRTIYVMFNFEDQGPDSAIWERVIIKHPVGSGMLTLKNPALSNAGRSEVIASAAMLGQVNEIFRYVLLDPRKQEFEAAMKELLELPRL